MVKKDVFLVMCDSPEGRDVDAVFFDEKAAQKFAETQNDLGASRYLSFYVDAWEVRE